MLSVTVAPTAKAKCSKTKQQIPLNSLRLTNEFTRPDGRSMSTNYILSEVTKAMAKRAVSSPLAYAYLPTDEAIAVAKQVLEAVAEGKEVKEEWTAFRCTEKTLKRPREDAIDFGNVPFHMRSAVGEMFPAAFKKYAKIGGKENAVAFLANFVLYVKHVLQAKKGNFAEEEKEDENGDFLYPTVEEAVQVWEEKTGEDDVSLYDAALSAAAASVPTVVD